MISKSVIRLVTFSFLVISSSILLVAQESLTFDKTAFQSTEYLNKGASTRSVVDFDGTFATHFLPASSEPATQGFWWSNIKYRFRSTEKSKNVVNATVNISFANFTKHKISIYWVNNGSEKRYLEIEKNQKRTQSTYENHLWRIKIGKRVIANYKATGASSQQVEIVSTDVDAGSISNKRDAEQKCSNLASGANQTWSGKWKKSSGVCELIKLNTQILEVTKPAPRPKPTSTDAVNCPETLAPNQVLLYSEENFQGDCTSFVGYNREARRYKPAGGGESRIRSLKIGSEVGVRICARSRFKGRCRSETASEIAVFDPEKKRELWRSISTWKRVIAKPVAPKPCAGLNKPNPGVEAAAEQVTIFTEPNFGGSCKSIDYKGRDQKPWPYSVPWNYESRDKFYNNGDMRKRKPPFNSIMIGSGVVVTVCTAKNFRGTCKDFRESVGDLTAEGFAYNSVNSFKIYTLNPKKYVNPLLPNNNQVTICQQRKFGTGCRKLDVGNYDLRSSTYRYIHVGANAKAQTYTERSFYGQSEVYNGGSKQPSTAPIKSIRVMSSSDELAVLKTRPTPRPIATPDPTPAPSSEVAQTNRENIFITTVDGSKCLAVKDGKANDNNPVVLENCRNTESQKWTFTTDNRIRGLAGMCLTRSSGLYIESCQPLASQRWKISDSNQLSGLSGVNCLTSSSLDQGSLKSVRCEGISEQRWLFEEFLNESEPSGSAGTEPTTTRKTEDHRPPNSNYKLCAVEGRSCNYLGQVSIAYGVGDQFEFKTFTGKRRESAVCNNATFGDPSPGKKKRCYIRQLKQVVVNHAPPAGGYTFCVDAPYRCNFNFVGTVAFGANGFFKYKRGVVRGITCNAKEFGGDPAPGIKKKCYTKFEKRYVPKKVAPTESTKPAPPPGSGWRVCGTEGQNCSFRGKGTVAFGYSPRLGGYKYKQNVTNRIACKASNFGAPATSERPRACYVRLIN